MTKQVDLLEGLSREQYLRQQVKPEGFPVLEEDWQKLLQWVTRVSGSLYFYSRQLEKSGRWDEFWKNQLLVILIDLASLDAEACKRQFMANKGTSKEKEILKQLEDFVRDIVARLKRCEYNLILSHRSEKEQGGILGGIAAELAKCLEHVIDLQRGQNVQKGSEWQEQTTINSLSFFRILDVVCGLQGRYEYDLDRVLKSGEIEPALAVLYIFLKNYSRRAVLFNRRLGDLPGFYLREILKSHPRGALTDHTWIVLNKTPDVDPVLVPAGTAFAGGTKEDGTELHYLSAEQVVVTDIQLDRIFSVLFKQSNKGNFPLSGNPVTALYRQEIPLLAGENAPELFGDRGGESMDVPVGWLIASPMFDLREGDRKVELHLMLSAKSALFLVDFLKQFDEQNREGVPEEIFGDAFVIQVCSQEGWLSSGRCETQWDAARNCILVRFSLGGEMPVVSVCSEELHGLATRYPAIQMILNKEARFFPYSWASQVEFETLTVKVNVEGITNLKIYNEFGESALSAPFYPFGVQAGKGNWFVVGNYEMACKPLIRANLHYKWQQLPTKKGGLKEHYAAYAVVPGIDNYSFQVKTQVLKERKWVDAVSPERLFRAPEKDSQIDEEGSVTFPVGEAMPVINVTEEGYALGKVGSGFLRVMLETPEMGFGNDFYRRLFTQTMMEYSSKAKGTPLVLPAEPITPIMNELMLSYEAEETFSLAEGGQLNRIGFYQMKPLAWEAFQPFSLETAFPLADPAKEAIAHLLFAFRNAQGNGIIRIYFDIGMCRDGLGVFEKVPEEMTLNWYYNDGRNWQQLSSGQVLRENTYVFTHAGLVELALPIPVAADWLDSRGCFWVRASIGGDYAKNRSIRGAYVNVVEVVADGGNGAGLAAGTITQSVASVSGLESVDQIVSGFGGCPAEDEKYLSLRMAHRIACRGRAVNPVDFERMAMEQFPVLEKVCCIPLTEAQRQTPAASPSLTRKIHLIVMSREQGGTYPLCSLTTLQDIRQRLSAGISPFAKLEVSNPVYEKIRIHCWVELYAAAYAGATLQKLQDKINHYIAPWFYKQEMPALNRGISLRGLYMILVNEEEVSKLSRLRLERVDERDEEKKYEELDLSAEAAITESESTQDKPVLSEMVESEVIVWESVCGGVFIPDEKHIINL